MDMRLHSLLLLVAMLLPSAARAQSRAATSSGVVDTLHGVAVADPFRWLEALDAPATRDWVRQRDSMARAHLERLPAYTAVRERLRALGAGQRLQAPVRAGGKLFFRAADVTGTARVGLLVRDCERCPDRLLAHSDSLGDPALTLASGSATGVAFEPSPDGRLVAFGVVRRGMGGWATLRIRDVASGRDVDSLTGVRAGASVTWTPDGRAFYYGRFDVPAPGTEQTARPGVQRLTLHRVGTPQASDVTVYARTDRPRWRYIPSVSADGRWLVVAVSDGSSPGSRILVGTAEGPTRLREILADSTASVSPIDVIHHEGRDELLVVTTQDAPRGQIVALPLTDFTTAHAADGGRPPRRRIVVAQSEIVLSAAQVSGGRLLVEYFEDGYPRLATYSAEGMRGREIAIPVGLIAWSGYRASRTAPEAVASLSGVANPGTIYRIDLTTGNLTTIATAKLSFDPDQFVSRRVFARSADGTRVPILLVHRKDLPPGEARPTWLYAYGAFATPAFPWFQAQLIPWLETGGVYALAGVRGGGDYGESWRTAGTRANRRNAVDDLVAAAEWLVANNVAAERTLVLNAQSAGTPLAGAAIARRPDLFAAALLEIPLADMVRFDQFTGGAQWYGEFGDPKNAREFSVLHSYSPYHRLQGDACYPPTLITAGDRDAVAVPSHAYKLAAVLERHQQCRDKPILLRMSWGAGHAMGATVDSTIDAWAAQLAFAHAHLPTTAAPSNAAHRDSLSVSFLANEGVLLTGSGTAILIDALFGDGLPGYGVVSRGTRDALERGAAPFDKVDHVLATHAHRDHFDAGAVARFLRANSRATLVTTPDAIALLRAADSAGTVTARAIGVEVAPSARRQVATTDRVTIHALGLPHGQTTRPVANIGFLIEMDGRRIIHLGDTTVGADAFAPLGLAGRGVDLALLPYWYLTSPELREAVRREMRPSEILVLHTPAPGYESAFVKSKGGWDAVMREIQAAFPNARAAGPERTSFVLR